MSKKFTELRFEEWIEASLLKNGYVESFVHSNENEGRYDKELCLATAEVIEFIKETQGETYGRLEGQFGQNTDKELLKTIDKTIAQRGIVETLRGGVATRGCLFDLVYFQPKSSMNPDHQVVYRKNRFVVVRQLHYSKRNRNSIDMVVFLNGVPIVTLELKNQLTGQNFKHSENQYKNDRDPSEPLFHFKRCLVHFCVDNDQVSMTTRLNGVKTRFLPYNRDIVNPVVDGDYKTNYLWNEVLTPDSLLDIIQNFVLVAKESDSEWNGAKGKVETKEYEVQVFPRFHQLDVLRNLKEAVRREGVGHNYLIQHTTGAGKSYSIGWLSHLLTSLYQKEGDTKRMFDTILVITDRKVLDKQLQNTISKLEQTKGVVNPVDINSAQLKAFLEKGKDVVITTIQKFPFISQVISELKGNTFGVIIDEVHSSQTGETSKHLKMTLSTSEDEDEEDIDYEEIIRREIESRGKQPHISFFGFTGTPKNKTLELFGRKNAEGHFVPFHSYSMKQSIAEGFTLDVLRHYTTYERYFKVLQTSEEDKEVPESKVKKELVRFVDSHPETITQKVSIILDHFITSASKKIEGKGRGMVVVRSRKHCVLFHEEMVRQMRQKGLNYSCLVGFSGSIFHNGRENTEESLNSENGLQGNNIPEGLKDPRFRILIVSNKFQTGFDEPLLQSMYVDKKLSGVQCVQTLSRLNRMKSGKADPFVLDFVNKTEDIVSAFQPYFTSTVLTEETDPDKLYDLLYEIESYNLYTALQVDEFCKVFYSATSNDAAIHPLIDRVVTAFRERLNEEEQEAFKSKIQSFIRLYAYISQIATFAEAKWEKSYVFLRSLNKKLPLKDAERVSVVDYVDLDSLRIQIIGESSLSLMDEQGEVSGISGAGGKSKDMEDKLMLSEIIQRLNEVYGMNLTNEDAVTIGFITERLVSSDDLRKVMNGNNSEEVKMEHFSQVFKEAVIDFHGERIDFYKNVMDPHVLPIVTAHTYRSVLSQWAS